MDLKKIISILAVMSVIGVFLVAVQPATAAKTTEIKAYYYNAFLPPGAEINTDMYVNKSADIDISATLHVNGGKPQWFRYMHCYIYNSKGELIVHEERNSGFGGIARFWVDKRKWNTGTYKISIIYWGNSRYGYPRADKNITLHLV